MPLKVACILESMAAMSWSPAVVAAGIAIMGELDKDDVGGGGSFCIGSAEDETIE